MMHAHDHAVKRTYAPAHDATRQGCEAFLNLLHLRRVVEWVVELVGLDQRKIVQELVHEIVQERVGHTVDDPNVQVTPSAKVS